MKKKAGIISLVLALILAAAVMLPGCTTPESQGTATPTASATENAPGVTHLTGIEKGGSATPAETTEFGRMLGQVPYSFLKEHDIWFGDPGEAKQLHGFGNIKSLADFNQFSDEEKKQATASLGGIAGLTVNSNWGRVIPLIGFDQWMVESDIFVDTPPPWGFSIIEGLFDDSLIQSKLTELGYQKVEHGSQSYFSIYGDYEPNLQNPIHQQVLAALNRVAVLNQTIVTAPATEILTGVLDTMADKQESILDNAAGKALASSLGEVLSSVIMSPDRIIDPSPGHSSGLPLFDFTIPADWGKLHPYNMVGMGYKDDGKDRFWTVSLFYTDASAASADAGTLTTRMKSYILNTQFKDRGGAFSKAIPLTDLFEVGQPQVQSYPGGATLTVECRLKPETGSSQWFRFGLTFRDLLLAPDPAPYVKASPTPSVTPQPTASRTPLSLDESQKQLKEKGSTLTGTVENASILAGYPVAIPAFIPEGFVPRDNDGQGGILAVYQPTFPAPNAPIEVSLTYAQSSDFRAPRGPSIILIQSNNQGEVLMNNPVDIEISGHPGKKSMLPAAGSSPERLVLSWKDGNIQYMLQGTLQSPLDEAILLKVANSVGVK